MSEVLGPVPAYVVLDSFQDGLHFQLVVPKDECDTVKTGAMVQLDLHPRVIVTKADS